MASDGWGTLSFGELTENFDSIRVPVKQADRRPGPYPYYGASGVVDRVDGYLFDGDYLLVAEDGENLRTRQTPIAFIATGKFWVNNHAHIVRGNGKATTRFLEYAMSRTDISGYLTGSTMPKLTQGNMNRIRVLTPPRPVQDGIVSILGTLDDKIELNRQMNETLEATARAVFKSWFVDFDPVRAKMDGQKPLGMDEETAAIFPDRFEESEVGHIPAKWTTKKLGALVEFAYGKALKAGDREAGDVAVFGSNGQVGWHDQRLVKGPGIVVGRKGNPGIVKWSQIDFFPIDTTFYVVPIGDLTSLNYLFFALENAYLPGLAADSAVPGLNRNLAYMNDMLVPPGPIIERFDILINDLRHALHANAEQSSTLTALRDTLLPKLLSGEICVNKGERPANAAL